MDDITPSLLEKIKKDFEEKSSKNIKLKELIALLENGNVDYEKANEYSRELGLILAESFKKNLSSEQLPDGKLYYNIANRIIPEMMHNNYDLISNYCLKTQETLNIKANLKIKSIPSKINEDRITRMVDIVSGKDEYDEISYMLDEPVVNFSQSIVDDSVKQNAEFHYKSGLNPKIIRISTGDCCSWCERIAGIYDYEGINTDVFRRHKNCACLVIYKPVNGKFQNVYNKRLFNIDVNEKNFNLNQNPLTNLLKSGEILDTINVEKQIRHIFSNSKIMERSYLFGNIEDSVALYRKYKGTGTLVYDRKGRWLKKERVVCEESVGVHINPITKEKMETKNLMIVYSKTGSHLYPRKGQK